MLLKLFHVSVEQVCAGDKCENLPISFCLFPVVLFFPPITMYLLITTESTVQGVKGIPVKGCSRTIAICTEIETKTEICLGKTVRCQFVSCLKFISDCYSVCLLQLTTKKGPLRKSGRIHASPPHHTQQCKLITKHGGPSGGNVEGVVRLDEMTLHDLRL